ncbi:protein D3-like [Cylas formicarius]|uniref:protein D3-like n=1 Tax=Cylas formicarius TaxID=197179 RepID=UPI0029586642|nr:protein D3-like [Cylas formicarius]
MERHLALTFAALAFLVTCISRCGGENIAESMEKHQVVPDVIEGAPKETAEVVYSGGVQANLGNELAPTQVKDEPSVKWNADENAFYTICMTDPDAPSRQTPKNREWRHWLVGNIPGVDISKGEVLTGYVGAGPPKGTGLHRYVILIYKQPKKLTFDEPRVPNTSGANRPLFSIKKFSTKYNMELVAGNFFQAQWDDYVPKLHQQLKG